MQRVLMIISLLSGPAFADTVVPTRTIRAQSVISAEDLQVKSVNIAGAYSALEQVVGLEARVALYPGRPVRHGDVGPPAVIERNQLIPIVFSRGGLMIRTEGRALDRAGVGDWIQVMNLTSRATIMGQVQQDGSISVSN
jgi:flagella basal body P-ring formation protein FlgA